MLGFAFHVSSLGLLLMASVVGLVVLYWSRDIFKFLNEQIKIISFARTLPSPPTIPLIGCYQGISRNSNILELITQWNCDIKKTFSVWISFKPIILTTDPRDIEILLMNSTAVDKDLFFYKKTIPFMEDFLLMGTGDANYRSLKKLILPLTNGKYIANFMEIFQRQSNQFVKVLGEKAGKGEFDVGKNVIHCIGDITYEVLFNIPGEAQQGKPDEKMLHGTDRMIEVMMQRIARIWEYHDIFFRMFNENYQEYSLTNTYIHECVDNILKEKKKKYFEDKRNNIPHDAYRSLIDLYIDYMMRTDSWTDIDLKNQLIGFIVGIHDTLHGVLSFLLLMLAMHPEVQEKVREEVREIAGDGIIDQEATNKMKYTHMVILETIRLFPVTPLFPRKTTEELKLATCTLPRGTSVLLFAFGTHRDPAHWTDPETFNPERFTPENSKDRHKFAFVPFSNGPRMCGGYNFALASLKIITADILRHYKLATSKKIEDIHLYMTISVRSTNGYPISVERLN